MRLRFVSASFLLWFCCACGSVVFVDPDAALKERLVFESVERLVIPGDPRHYFHTRIKSREQIAALRFEVEGAEGRFAIPRESMETQPCGDEATCVSITMAPGLPEHLQTFRLLLPALGHQSEHEIMTRPLSPYGFVGKPLPGNREVSLFFTDPIRLFYAMPESVTSNEDDEPITREVYLFPRRFDIATLGGRCPPGSEISDEIAFQPAEGNPSVAVAPFDQGTPPALCALFRPSLPEGGLAVADVSIEAGALVTRYRHVYSPLVENAPLVFVPIFDLEFADESRCAPVQAALVQMLRDAAASVEIPQKEVVEISAIDLARLGEIPCRQDAQRSFSAEEVARSVHLTLDGYFPPSRRVRVLFVYVTNLNLAMPRVLEDSFRALQEHFSSSTTRRAHFLSIAPDRAGWSGADTKLPWIPAEEPELRTAVLGTLQKLWPFKTELHTDDTIVPLLEEAEARMVDYYRVCETTHSVVLTGIPTAQSDVLVVEDDAPAYRVGLPERLLEPANVFERSVVTVDWEGCSGWCEQPNPSAESSRPWLLTGGCP